MPKVDLSKIVYDEEGNGLPIENFEEELSQKFVKIKKKKKKFDDGTGAGRNDNKRQKVSKHIEKEEEPE